MSYFQNVKLCENGCMDDYLFEIIVVVVVLLNWLT